MLSAAKIRPCLWFDDQAEEAVAWYLSIFPNSQVTGITRYTQAGQEIHHMPAGMVMTIEFELDGNAFIALNGGPVFQFNEAISFQIDCETQADVDHYWDRLSAGGDPGAQRCGWLKDQFGLSWQIVPLALRRLLSDPNPKKGRAVMTALLEMKKIDAVRLQQIADQA